MKAIYDYNNGHIEIDFKFVEYETKCRLSGLPAYAGYSDRCIKCKYNCGTLHPWNFIGWHRLDKSYVLCNHKDAKDTDSEDCHEVKWLWYDKFRNEALCALDC